MKNYIYLDNAATVRCFDVVNDIAYKVDAENWYNSSSLYRPSLEVGAMIDDARAKVALALGASPSEIIFVGGATEANNWAIQRGIKQKKGKVLYSTVEHPSVKNTIKSLYENNFAINVDKDGKIDWKHLEQHLSPDTVFVSFMHVCGNTGVINDIKRLVSTVKSVAPNAIVHSDGVQAFCKWDYSVADLGVDMYTVSAHKVGGKKGLGVLYIKKGLNIPSFLSGGGHEFGKRAGTLNNSSIISLPYAIDRYKQKDTTHYTEMHDYIKSRLKTIDDTLFLYNDLPHIFTVCFKNKPAQIVQSMLCDRGVIVGTGSACSSKDKINLSLTGRDIDDSYLKGAIRISLGPHNTMEEIKTACDTIVNVVSNFKI